MNTLAHLRAEIAALPTDADTGTRIYREDVLHLIDRTAVSASQPPTPQARVVEAINAQSRMHERLLQQIITELSKIAARI
jgi:hypothetical protein